MKLSNKSEKNTKMRLFLSGECSSFNYHYKNGLRVPFTQLSFIKKKSNMLFGMGKLYL